ncbi:MAG: ATP-dependent DNA ligase [Streptosporangiales bacterium]|nr:ATP-dependent DNA ligase [Streptosporangiales bacterium]
MGRRDGDGELKVGRRRVGIGNPGKVLFRDVGVTKRDLAAYYRDVAAVMLPHIRGKPLALHRFPDGIDADGFFQKQLPASAPEWLGRVTVPRERGGEITMTLCEDAASLVYLADQAVVAIHPWLTTTEDLWLPDRMVFDLDPPGDDFVVVQRAALELRDLLDDLGLPSFVMTTGSRGLHVVVPLRLVEDIDDVRDFARQVADLLAGRHPEQLTTEVRKEKRAGRLFLDVLRNAYGQHAVAPYSVRALVGAPVAMPLRWNEVADDQLTPRRWGVRDVEKRLADDGAPWHGMRRRAHTLGPARSRLAAVRD